MKIAKELKKAIIIGIVCISSYIASYYMRNILSVCTPEMLKTGLFTKEIVGSFSSVYFFAYAIGQLINGIIGDRIQTKNMVMAGLGLCGISSVLFAFCNVVEVRLVLFFIMGFALSMLRGPLIKTISENTRPDYAKVCCVFFSFASFAGPLIASLFAMVFNWKYTFVFSGISCICIALGAYAMLSNMEKRKVIKSVDFKQTDKKPKGVLSVFKLDNYIFYLFVSAIVEISAISINFWLPTYLFEHLGFQKDVANGIFSLITLVCSFVPFVALIVLKIFKDNDIKMVRFFFALSAIFMGCVLLTDNIYLSLGFLFLSRISVSFSGTVLWSIYIPSQAKSGMVSTINGILEAVGYSATAGANVLFAFLIDGIGWRGIVMVWALLMATGAVIGRFKFQKKCKA